jgi:hypothetical protein
MASDLAIPTRTLALNQRINNVKYTFSQLTVDVMPFEPELIMCWCTTYWKGTSSICPI